MTQIEAVSETGNRCVVFCRFRDNSIRLRRLRKNRTRPIDRTNFLFPPFHRRNDETSLEASVIRQVFFRHTVFRFKKYLQLVELYNKIGGANLSISKCKKTLEGKIRLCGKIDTIIVIIIIIIIL